jgi:rhamnose transport system substrate-binding protein
MKTRIFQIIAALTVLSMLLAACGGGAPAPAQPTAAPAPTQAPPTEAPAAAEPTKAPEAPAAGVAEATPGIATDMILLPKFMGNQVFEEANDGAEEAHAELKNPGKLTFTGPTADNSVAGQIEIMTNAPTQGAKVMMLSNNAGDQIGPAAQAARDAGMTVVTWDSPIPSAQGEQVFVAQVDFKETGVVMADMALSILGADGGKFAVLSASPDAANQNAWIAAMKEALKDPKYSKLELLDVVYGNDQSEDSYNQALALVSKYPDMGLIMSPTSIGIVAAAKAMQDEGLCDKVKVSGLGLPSELEEYTLNGCAPEFALWSFVDLGYLTYYTSYMLANGQIEAREGETFKAGRMGEYTIEKDPTRDNGLRILMGPFTVYTKDNVSGGAGQALTNKTKEIKGGEAVDMILLPKFMGNQVFEEANNGAQEAHKELQNSGKLTFTGPTADNSVAGQIEIVTNAPTQGAKALMISNNAGDQIGPAAQAARDAGMTVVTWDSPIPSAEGEQVFVAQVDFNETGVVMADMTLSILGADGGKFAILSASPDAANQNAWIAAMKEALKDPKYSKLELLDVVYGNDQSEDSYNQALALVSKYPDMKLIMSPTSIGIVAAAKAMQDEGLCDKVKVSGLGLPSELAEYVENGCAPEFALWSFVDLGYLTYWTTYGIATGQIEAREGETFTAGRMGEYSITKDPTRESGLRILMGPFTVYTKDNMPK